MIPLLNRGGLMKGFVQGADRQQTTLLPEWHKAARSAPLTDTCVEGHRSHETVAVGAPAVYDKDGHKLRADPGRVMDHRVHGVTHVDEPAKPTETEHHQRKADSQNHRLVPGQRRDPSQKPAPPAHASGNLQAGADREHGEQGWKRDQEREEGLDELEARSVFRISKEMVHPDRKREDNEHDESKPPHRIAV